MMSIYYACAVALLSVMTGCTDACMGSGVEGSYKLTVKGINYALQLRAGGRGTLSASGKEIGNLRWTLSEAPGQQILELDAAGAVYSMLSELTTLGDDPAAQSTNRNLVTQGMIGSEPVCTWGGRMKKLVVNYDEPLAFVRSKDQP